VHRRLRAVARSRGACLGLLTAAWGVAACTDARSGERPAALREGVVRGEVSPEGGREDAVLLLRTELDGDPLICSASLVADNLVLTARHCVSYLVRGVFSCTAQGELVSLDSGAGELGTHLEAASLEFYSGATPRTEPIAYGKEVVSTLSETICMNDLAFVVLDRHLDLPVLPLRLRGQAERDEPVTLVGYGLDDAMSQTGRLDVETQPRTRKADLVIADVGPVESGQQISTVPPRSLLVEGPAGCLGDSGGPLLARESGAVLGVYSLLGGESCLGTDARHLFAHVPLFPLLARQAFDAAGSEPTAEPGVTPSGEGGGAGDGTAGDGTSAAGTSSGAGGTGGRAGEGEGGDAPFGSAGAGGDLARDGSADDDAGRDSGATPGAAGTPEPPKGASPPHRRKGDGCAVTPHAENDAAFGVLLLALASCLGRRVGRAVRR
jgi:hypothetical protein